MMPTPSERAGKLVSDQLSGEHDAAAHARLRAKLVARVTRGQHFGRVPRWAAATVAIAVIAAVAIWQLRRAEDDRALSFLVGANSAGRIDAYYAPPLSAELPLRFSDGSTIRIAPGGGARVSRLDARGATLLLERGRAQIAVEQRANAQWRIIAGPYNVRVTGTAFWIEWTADAGLLEVVMERGSVELSGPGLDPAVVISAGQRFTTQTTARLEHQASPIESAILPAPSASAEIPKHRDDAILHAEPTWMDLAKEGRYRQIVEAAEQRGIERTLSGAGLGELGALADAARYTGRSALAQRALTTIRQRFATSARAKSAAFVLGRMLDDGGNPSAALGWYDRYLAEAPGGPLAAEALGRRMLALQRLGRSDDAKRAATLYLQRFPKGPYAAPAEKLVAP
jgi:hypothetical protein